MTKEQCDNCITTHTENGKEVPGTMYCKNPMYAHLMACSCLDYTVKEVR